MHMPENCCHRWRPTIEECENDINDVTILTRFLQLFRKSEVLPVNLAHGKLGETAARRHLQRKGMKHLFSNFKSKRGEIDLVFRDGDCLVFVEVKTQSSEEWARPARRVNFHKRRNLTRTALDYLRLLKDSRVKTRFDVVEVILESGEVTEIRHLPDSFAMPAPYGHFGLSRSSKSHIVEGS